MITRELMTQAWSELYYVLFCCLSYNALLQSIYKLLYERLTNIHKSMFCTFLYTFIKNLPIFTSLSLNLYLNSLML